jgi:hypothetical protein
MQGCLYLSWAFAFTAPYYSVLGSCFSWLFRDAGHCRVSVAIASPDMQTMSVLPVTSDIGILERPETVF